jgi:hypothetical protein
MKARRSFFAWFSKEYYFKEKAIPVAIWDGNKYVCGEKQKWHYIHYWRALWGNIDNEQRRSLVAAADCIERVANSSWSDWEDGSIRFFKMERRISQSDQRWDSIVVQRNGAL